MSVTQTTLDFDAADQQAIESDRPLTKAEKFRKFDQENPHVYAAVVRYAFTAQQRGRKRIAIELIYNLLRWEEHCPTTGNEYKLNNNYKRFYVEKLTAQYPQLATLFARREVAGSGSS